MKNIHLFTLLFIVLYSASCTKEEKVVEQAGKPCLVTSIVDSSLYGIDTTWITYDAQSRPVRTDYKNIYYFWKYIYQDNQVIEQQVVNSTGEVIYQHTSYLNAQGLAEYTIFPGNDTLFMTYDTQGRLIGERRKGFDFNYEYNYDTNGDLIRMTLKNYLGTAIKGNITIERYPDIILNPNANTDGLFIKNSWNGRFSTHAVKKQSISTFTYELDGNKNIKKTTITDSNNNIRTRQFEYKCS